MEQGKRTSTDVGYPQGATVSPLPANIRLHYARDLWVQQWRRRRALREIIFVRYAGDFVLGFQRVFYAKRFLGHLRERRAKFRLELHPEKTRLLRFGRFAAAQLNKNGESGAPQTFNFLELTHGCSRSKTGMFLLRRHTMLSRLTAKVHEITLEPRRRLHEPIVTQGKRLGAVLRGHSAYDGVPTNIEALDVLRTEVTHRCFKSLRRRSLRRRLNWTLINRLAQQWRPRARIVHPWPQQRFAVRTRDKSPVR